MNAKSCVEFVLQAMNNVDDEYLNVKIAVDYLFDKHRNATIITSLGYVPAIGHLL